MTQPVSTGKLAKLVRILALGEKNGFSSIPDEDLALFTSTDSGDILDALYGLPGLMGRCLQEVRYRARKKEFSKLSSEELQGIYDAYRRVPIKGDWEDIPQPDPGSDASIAREIIQERLESGTED